MEDFKRKLQNRLFKNKYISIEYQPITYLLSYLFIDLVTGYWLLATGSLDLAPCSMHFILRHYSVLITSLLFTSSFIFPQPSFNALNNNLM